MLRTLRGSRARSSRAAMRLSLFQRAKPNHKRCFEPLERVVLPSARQTLQKVITELPGAGSVICWNRVWRGVSCWNRVWRGVSCWNRVWRGPVLLEMRLARVNLLEMRLAGLAKRDSDKIILAKRKISRFALGKRNSEQTALAKRKTDRTSLAKRKSGRSLLHQTEFRQGPGGRPVRVTSEEPRL